jgi:hypothetical protein
MALYAFASFLPSFEWAVPRAGPEGDGMRRLVGVGVALLVGAGGCTSVKMVQRDGCWVRRTEKVFGRVHEEVGPCARAQPKWAEDRLLRLVQECVADADWRWHSRALETWSRGLPYATPQPRQEELLKACMEEARAGMAMEIDAAALKAKLGDLSGRISELSSERDALRGDVAREQAKQEDRSDKLVDWIGKRDDRLVDWLGKSHDSVVDFLGKGQQSLAESLGLAAQKPPGNATATATSSSTSDGKASNDSGATLAASAATPPAPREQELVAAKPVVKPVVKAVKARRAAQPVRAAVAPCTIGDEASLPDPPAASRGEGEGDGPPGRGDAGP